MRFTDGWVWLFFSKILCHSWLCDKSKSNLAYLSPVSLRLNVNNDRNPLAHYGCYHKMNGFWCITTVLPPVRISYLHGCNSRWNNIGSIHQCMEWVVIRTNFTETHNNNRDTQRYYGPCIATHNNIDKDVNIVKFTHIHTRALAPAISTHTFIIVTSNEMPMSVPINIQSLKLFNYLLL